MHSGIYIHIPFCESKCGYCDFFSITEFDQVNEFLSGLEKEIIMYANEYVSEEIFDTIYIGGGTPSVLSVSQISNILGLLHKKYSISKNAEITIEINPGTINQSKLIDLKNAGINRLSIGVQSFNEDELQFLGRIHNSNQALQSVHNAREVGFDNINIDLIYALPNQTLITWETSMRKAIEINPEHISAYNLTIEKGTPFFDLKNKGILKPQSESKEKEFFNFTDSTLAEAGYNHYEVSSFARGEENFSRHNSKYWQHKYYLGFGPSAHSFWNNKRWGNYKSVGKYIANINENKKPIDFEESLSIKDLEFEHIFLSLRTYNGLSLKEFQKRFNSDFTKKYNSIYSQFIDANYAEIDETDFKLTKSGMALCDEILPAFIKN
jgi:putative oxygen-independent coproporphyrinogen III oxidase